MREWILVERKTQNEKYCTPLTHIPADRTDLKRPASSFLRLSRTTSFSEKASTILAISSRCTRFFFPFLFLFDESSWTKTIASYDSTLYARMISDREWKKSKQELTPWKENIRRCMNDFHKLCKCKTGSMILEFLAENFILIRSWMAKEHLYSGLNRICIHRTDKGLKPSDRK